jgi:hypothetical protein
VQTLPATQIYRLAGLGGALALAACPSTPAVLGPCPAGFVADAQGLCWQDRPDVDPSWNDEWPDEVPDDDACDEPPPDLQNELYADCTSTHEGDIRLRSPEEIQEFCDQYDCVRGGIDLGATEGDGQGKVAEGIHSLDDLSCLVAARYLFVGTNDDMTDATLPNLTGLGGALTFAGNRNLEAISLPALRFVGGDLSIQDNLALQSLDFSGLEAVFEFFFIFNNPQLPTSQPEAIRDQLCPENIGGAIAIAGNGPG